VNATLAGYIALIDMRIEKHTVNAATCGKLRREIQLTNRQGLSDEIDTEGRHSHGHLQRKLMKTVESWGGYSMLP
jgi:hypothetical protein